MAMVDFTNAVIEVDSTYSAPPFAAPEVNVSSGSLRDAGGSQIGGSNHSKIVDQLMNQVHSYSGTFTADGTEFYIYSTTGSPSPARWRISNISFHAGDTYSFQIPIELTCL